MNLQKRAVEDRRWEVEEVCGAPDLRGRRPLSGVGSPSGRGRAQPVCLSFGHVCAGWLPVTSHVEPRQMPLASGQNADRASHYLQGCGKP